MPETQWEDIGSYRPQQPFDRDPVKITRAMRDDESLWNPVNRLQWYGEVFAAGNMENPMAAANSLLNRPDFEYDPEFDWRKAAEESEYYNMKRESFLHVGSQEEWTYMEQKLRAEQEGYEELFSHGMIPGLLSGMANGLISPTTLMPLMGAGKGIKGIAQAFTLAAVAAGMDELVLHADQELRTIEESGVAVGASAILGGLLGSAAVGMKAATRKQIERQLEVVFAEGKAGDHLFYPGGTVNAAEAVHDVGGFKREWLVGSIARLNNHGRLVTDKAWVNGKQVEASPTLRRAATTMTSNGMKFEGNTRGIPTTPDGEIETRVLAYDKPLADALYTHQDAYARYLHGKASVGAVGKVTASFRGSSRSMVPTSKMTADEFSEAITDALNTGDKAIVPEVQEAVDAYRKITDFVEARNELYFKEEQVKRGKSATRTFTPFEEVFNEDGTVESYFHHMYAKEKIQGQNFDDWIAGNVRTKLYSYGQKELEHYREAVATFEEQLAAKGVRGTDAYKAHLKELRAELAAYRKAMDEEQIPAIRAKQEENLLAMENNIVLTKALAEGEDIRGVSTRLVDELYESIEGITGAKLTKRGAVHVNVATGDIDFSEVAQDIAKLMANKIRGDVLRVSGMDFLQAKRGPELLRMLHDEYSVKKQFLETDPGLISRSYVRQMAADLEIKRAYGSVNGAEVIAKGEQEYDALIEAISKSGKETKGKAGRAAAKLTKGAATKDAPVNEATKEIVRLRAQKMRALDDFRALIDRARHQRGVPNDPSGILHRMGRAVMNANVPLYMGMVLPASIPDIARPLFKFHARRIIGDGVFLRLKNPELYAGQIDQLQLAGAGLDVINHTTTRAMWDIYNDAMQKGTALERGIEFLSHKTGLIALYEQWTVGLKKVTSVIAAGEISRGIRLLTQGGKMSKADRTMYTEMLASLSLSPDMQRRIWKQMTEVPGGGTKHGDNWLPNTESWNDIEAVNAYRAALVKIAHFDTIITPGVAKPLWMDKNIGFRMAAQFRSFSDASTNKTLLATLQDVSVDVNGLRFLMALSASLGLGAMGFYARAAAKGGEDWTKAQNAPIETVLDEAIDRSGLLGWFGEGLRVMDQFALTQGIGRFGETGVTRRSSQGAIGLAAGPSFGTLDKMIRVLNGIDEPTQSTLHAARQLVPFNQVVWLNRIISQMENAIGENLPEKRGQ